MLLILCGYSATGKDTYQDILLERLPELRRAVSHTTRPKRFHEKDGREYYFVKPLEFFEMRESGDMLETREYKTYQDGDPTTWYYGLSVYEAPRTRESMAIAIVDHHGTLEIVEKLGKENVLVVYLECDEDELRRRAAARKDESLEFERRLADDKVKFQGIEKTYNLKLNTFTDDNGHAQNISEIISLLEDYRHGIH